MKKILGILLTVIMIIGIICVISLYIAESSFRNWIDINVFRKSISEENIVYIDLNSDRLNQVHIYNKYIAVLSNQKVALYNSHAEEVTNINVNIGSALFDSSEKYFVIAEDGGTDIYLILDKEYLWSNKVEGEIQLIDVNRNGYVAVVTKDSTYKSILTLYNSDGMQVFRSFFSQTKIIDVSISEDNKNIAIGEVDWSGAIIQSNIKIISVQNAKNNPDNAITYIYSAENGKLLTDVKYQSKNQILCMYDDEIDVIQNDENKKIVDVNNANIAFMSVNMNNNVVLIEEVNTGVFKTSSNVQILNTQKNGVSNTYKIEDMAKELYVKDNVIAVNTGTEIYFLHANGRLIKKYSTRQEITNVMFSNNVAGLIYKDKIIVINF